MTPVSSVFLQNGVLRAARGMGNFSTSSLHSVPPLRHITSVVCEGLWSWRASEQGLRACVPLREKKKELEQEKVPSVS